MDNKYSNNGSGLYVPAGFSVHEGSGYIIPRSPFGCQAEFAGRFSDVFNYDATASGASTGGVLFGNFWRYISDASNTAQIDTFPAVTFGNLYSSGSFGCMLIPYCANILDMGHQSSYATLNTSGFDFANQPGIGPGFYFPVMVGGPAAMMYIVSGYRVKGYCLRAGNGFTDVTNSTRSFNISLSSIEWTSSPPVDTFVDLATYHDTSHTYVWTGHNVTGWNADATRLGLEVTPQGGGNNLIDVYMDNVNIFSYTDTRGTIAQTGKFGIYAGAGAYMSRYLGLQL